MTIEIVSTESLRLHPLLKDVPEADPELIISMTIDIEERGIDQPLIVDEKGRVLDGRLRLKIACAEQMPEVPVRRASSADAATIIVQSLLQRRHYSKSALAYLAYPFFEQMAAEARQRQVNSRFVSASGSGSAQNALPVTTVEGIAARMTISRRFFFQAAEVHKLFAKHPAAKEKLEPQILSGDLCLGYAINGVAGIASTKGRSRGADDQLELFSRGIATLKIRFAKWDLIPTNKRMFVANEFAQTLTEAPPEIQDRVFAALQAARKAAR